ncbi:MAG: hypothetical protein V4685_05560 [Bacteroidota bacterium]
MAKAEKKKTAKEFTPAEKLTQSNEGFVKGREFNTAGEKDFGKTVRKPEKKKL